MCSYSRVYHGVYVENDRALCLLVFVVCHARDVCHARENPPRLPVIFACFVVQTAASSTISAMKKNSKANIMAEMNHLRKGGAGGWRDVLTVRESEEFDKIYRKQMEGSGLEMDFGEGLRM